jgi:signal peptidase I
VTTSRSTKAAQIVIWSTVVVVLGLFATKTFFIGFYHLPQNGMYPGYPKGARFFTDKGAYANASSVKRGDIIVFLREDKGESYIYVWRVIALPGETVEASGESLSVNGQPVTRQHLRDVAGAAIYREQLGDISYEVAFDKVPRSVPPEASGTVPPDHFFVMGDNRLQASDSRYLGPIAFSSIIGKKL